MEIKTMEETNIVVPVINYREVYVYDPETYEYKYSTLEMYSENGLAKFTPIANSTPIKPNFAVADHETNVFDPKKKKWKIVDDFRGAWYHCKTQKMTFITNLGERITNPGITYTNVMPPNELTYWDGNAWVIDTSKADEVKKNATRIMRNKYLKDYVDSKANVLHWEELNEIERGKVREYRNYLLNYPESSDSWYEEMPKKWDEYFATQA